MAVRIRMKKMGRRHRSFFRICAVDGRNPRDGRVIEELGHYDPNVRETDARAVLKADRIDYWLGVGALPSDKVSVLIKKYGSNGLHVEQQKAALERLSARRPAPLAPTASKPADESTAATEEAEPAAEEASPEGEGEVAGEAAAEE